jgi:hypothetical protein
MKGDSVASGSNNATTGHKLNAAALTAYLSTLDLRKELYMVLSRVRLTKDSTYGIH